MMSRHYLYFVIIVCLSAVVIPLSGARADEIKLREFLEEDNADNPPRATATATYPPTSTLAPPADAQGPVSFWLPPGVLDNFNQSDGPLGSNWSGDTADYAIVSNQMDVGTSEDIYWNASLFGIDQEVFVTLATIDPNADEIGLILKAQSSNDTATGLIEVLYDPTGHYVQVWTYSLSQGWQQRGTNISVTFANGDQMSAQARADGQVEVFRNGLSIGVRDASSWSFSANTGYIGLFNTNASNMVLDNFGGGTSDGSPTLTPTPVPCTDPLSCEPVSAIPAYWRCNIPECSGNDWLGAVINWPSWAAYENNGRTGNNSRTVYSIDGDQVLYAYMGAWADGCQIQAVSGTVLIIEWERGTDVWEEFYLNPGENHTINLTPPQNGALIEGPDNVLDAFRVTLSNCTPQAVPTLTPNASHTATTTPTSTNTPTPTSTDTPTDTPTPTNTSTNAPTTIPTNTTIPTGTATPTSSDTPQDTSTPSSISTPTLTNTPSEANTPTPTSTFFPVATKVLQEENIYLSLIIREGATQSSPPEENHVYISDPINSGPETMRNRFLP